MPSSPDTELIALDDPEVDWAALMAEMRELASGQRPADAIRATGQLSGEPHAAVPAGPRLSPADDSATIRPYPDPEAGHASRSLAQRVIRRTLRWYLWPVTAAMSAHNRAVSAVLVEHERQLALSAISAERLDRDLDRLEPPAP